MNEDALASSKPCYGLEDANKAIENIRNGIQPKYNLNLNLIVDQSDSEFIQNCSERIANVLEALEEHNPTRNFPSRLQLYLNFKLMKTMFRLRLTWIVGWVDHFTNIFKGKYTHMKDYFKYGNTKQGSIDFKDVKKLFEEMKANLDYKDSELKIKNIKEGMYVISK